MVLSFFTGSLGWLVALYLAILPPLDVSNFVLNFPFWQCTAIFVVGLSLSGASRDEGLNVWCWFTRIVGEVVAKRLHAVAYSVSSPCVSECHLHGVISPGYSMSWSCCPSLCAVEVLLPVSLLSSSFACGDLAIPLIDTVFLISLGRIYTYSWPMLMMR